MTTTHRDMQVPTGAHGDSVKSRTQGAPQRHTVRRCCCYGFKSCIPLLLVVCAVCLSSQVPLVCVVSCLFVGRVSLTNSLTSGKINSFAKRTVLLFVCVKIVLLWGDPCVCVRLNRQPGVSCFSKAYKREVSGSTPCGVVLVEGFAPRSARPRRCYQRIPPRAADGTTFPATNYGSEIRVVVSP